MEEASLWMQCNNCGEKHRRYPTEKPVYSARKCNRCQCHHAAKEVRNCILSTHEACGWYDLMPNHAMHDDPENYCWSFHSNSNFWRSSCIVWLASYNFFCFRHFIWSAVSNLGIGDGITSGVMVFRMEIKWFQYTNQVFFIYYRIYDCLKTSYGYICASNHLVQNQYGLVQSGISS